MMVFLRAAHRGCWCVASFCVAFGVVIALVLDPGGRRRTLFPDQGGFMVEGQTNQLPAGDRDAQRSPRRLRVRLLTLTLFVLMCIAAHTWFWPASRTNINVVSFQQIRKGMTRQEVEKLLGAPPGDYTSGRSSGSLLALPTAPGEKSRYHWASDEGLITVAFDKDDRVVGEQYLPLSVTPETLGGRIRRFLRRLRLVASAAYSGADVVVT
jgi:hypothetical protein